MQYTASKSGQPAKFEPTTRKRQHAEADWSQTVRVANSPAALGFNVAGVLTAALAITAAALLYHGAGSSVIFAAAVGCLAAAAVVQIVARRRLREELVKDARRHGAEDAEAAGRASLNRWLDRR